MCKNHFVQQKCNANDSSTSKLGPKFCPDRFPFTTWGLRLFEVLLGNHSSQFQEGLSLKKYPIYPHHQSIQKKKQHKENPLIFCCWLPHFLGLLGFNFTTEPTFPTPPAKLRVRHPHNGRWLALKSYRFFGEKKMVSKKSSDWNGDVHQVQSVWLS